MGRRQGQLGNIDGLEVGGKVGPRRGQGSGDCSSPLGPTRDFQRAKVKGSLCRPAKIEGQRTLEFRLTCGGGVDRGAVEAGPGQDQLATVNAALGGKAGRGAQESVKDRIARRQALALSIKTEVRAWRGRPGPLSRTPPRRPWRPAGPWRDLRPRPFPSGSDLRTDCARPAQKASDRCPGLPGP